MNVAAHDGLKMLYPFKTNLIFHKNLIHLGQDGQL